jgi:3-methyladenine DNA glycosylase/8-oxoguanine DNA glycosylase
LEDTLRCRSDTQSVAQLPTAERLLSERDSTLGRVIISESARWPSRPTEDAIWGLTRIVMAQQVSTVMACRLAERVKSAYPELLTRCASSRIEVASLRAMGLPESRAQCCVTITQQSEHIRARVQQGQTWGEALAGIKGIGPWTLSVFRIMVLRDPDELPLGDVGLQRAIANVYGRRRSIERLGEKWRPFRSVACWYLWRTLGNEQLG